MLDEQEALHERLAGCFRVELCRCSFFFFFFSLGCGFEDFFRSKLYKLMQQEGSSMDFWLQQQFVAFK